MSDETTPQDGKAMSPASAGSVADEVLSECKTCGLKSVNRGGEIVTLVNWKKNIVAQSPCPECMEEAGKAMAAFGARVAAARNDAFWLEFNRAE
jgi:hypothetical protein